jgi:hypothetical protein
MRTKPKTNTKWRTKLIFSRLDTKTKIQEIKTKGRRKKPIAVELLPALEHVPLKQLHNIFAHQIHTHNP